MPRHVKIVYVEHDPYLSDMFVTRLLMAGFAISYYDHPLKNVADFVDIERADLVLMGIMMPEMDGFTATALLQGDPRTKDIPVLGLSNLGQPKDLRKALRCGMWDHWVIADHTPDQVVKKIQAILAGEPRRTLPATARTRKRRGPVQQGV